MRAAGLVPVTLVLALALAGCSTGGGGDDDGGDDPGPGPSSDGAHAPTARPGGDPGSPGNTPPTASLEVSGAPQGGLVEFTVDGMDLDDDPLTWSLSFGDGSPNFSGQALPATLNHTYEAGSYEANLTVSDGKDSTYVIATVGVAEAAATQTVDGSYVAGFEGCAAAAYDQAGADAGGPAGGSTNGVTRVQFAVDPLTLGLPYTAVFEFDQGYLYVSVDFFSSGGSLLSSDNTGQSPNFGGLTVEGVVPADAATAVLFACGGPTSATVHYEA